MFSHCNLWILFPLCIAEQLFVPLLAISSHNVNNFLQKKYFYSSASPPDLIQTARHTLWATGLDNLLVLKIHCREGKKSVVIQLGINNELHVYILQAESWQTPTNRSALFFTKAEWHHSPIILGYTVASWQKKFFPCTVIKLHKWKRVVKGKEHGSPFCSYILLFEIVWTFHCQEIFHTCKFFNYHCCFSQEFF